MWYTTIKKYYSMGFYKFSDMSTFVKAGYITDVQYKEITGQSYISE